MAHRPIPEQHLRYLQSACVITDDDLPADVEKAYWEMKRCCDRVGAAGSMGPIEFAHIAFFTGYGKATKREGKPTIIDLIQSKEIKAGHPVEVECRESVREAIFKRLKGGDTVVVQFKGETEQSEIYYERVLVPAMAV